MPRRRGPKKLPSIKARLIGMGLRTRRTLPVKAQRKERENLRGQSIPEMFPYKFEGRKWAELGLKRTGKGALASHFQRVGRPQPIYGKPVEVVANTALTWDSEISDSLTKPKIRIQRPLLGTKQSIKRLSRKSLSRGGGGSQLLGKGARKTGSAKARRMAKPGGTRGAIPRREKRKQKKK